MAAKFYGRAIRSSGGPTDHHHKRGLFFTDVARSHFQHPKPGLTGGIVTPPFKEHPRSTHMRTHYKTGHLRLRRLPCGHGVLMVRGQFPDDDTYCIQCRDGRAVR